MDYEQKTIDNCFIKMVLNIVYIFRIVFSSRSTITLPYVFSMVGIFEFIIATIAVNDGILPLMERNVIIQWLSTEFSTCGKEKELKIFTAIATLKAFVIKFEKAVFEWGSRLETVQVMAMQMLTVDGIQCLVLLLKKYHHLKHET